MAATAAAALAITAVIARLGCNTTEDISTPFEHLCPFRQNNLIERKSSIKKWLLILVK